MYKVGIIGFGKMGMLHGALLCGTRKAHITAICDKSTVMRLGFKRVYKNVNVYSDADTMLEKEALDIILITTPTFNHKESVLKALDKGIPVFVEKPLAITAEQAARICKKANEKQLPVQVGFCNRFCASFAKTKELLLKNRIGKVKNIQASMFIGDVFEQHSGWRYKPELSGGGALMDFGIHMIDLLIHYFGEIDSIEDASALKLYSTSVEDEVTATLRFKNGEQCHFETSWSKKEYRKSYSKMEITGENGTIVVTDQTLDILDANGTKVEEYSYPDLYTGCFMDIGGTLYSSQMECFLTRVENTVLDATVAGCTPEQALYVQRVIEKIYKSAEEKVSMKVRDNDEY